MPKERKNCVLDIDQTLIASEPITDWDFENPENKKIALKFALHNMEDYYMVFERPYLQEFLDYLFRNYNVVIWTAASKDYALWIINKIILAEDPKRRLDFIFFSYHCELSKNECRRGPKDLALLWKIFALKGYTKDNTFIIDDLPAVCKLQKCNCIPVKPFEVLEEGSENDTVLKDLIPRLEKIKKKTRDGDEKFCLINNKNE